MAQATTRHFTMTIQELTRMAGDISSKAQSLEKRIKGWNLICGLFSEPRNTEEDLAHAYAAEAREVCFTAMRICYAWGLAGFKGNIDRFHRLGNILVGLHEREMRLSDLCRQAIQASKSTNVKSDSKEKQVAPQQKETQPTSSASCPVGRLFVIRITPADRKEASV